MLTKIRESGPLQLLLGLVIGMCFGFLLQKGGATYYDVILGQLLLRDFTVVKIMLSAVITGMAGVYAMRSAGLAELHIKPGAVGSSVIGGLLFGAGFALLGYCPGTIAGAVGHGSLDALLGGIPGIIAGCALFAALYPLLDRYVLHLGTFGDITVPGLLQKREWPVIGCVCGGTIVLFAVLETAGL